MVVPLPALDSAGRSIVVGSLAKIPQLPDWLLRDLPSEEVATLRSVEGSVMPVVEIDQHGYVWFGADGESRWFCLRPDELALVVAQ
jgi:hypothetical protein